MKPALAAPKLKNRTSKSHLQITESSKLKPKIVGHLNDWQYLEYSILRLICAWGRHFSEWSDKAAIHRHVWDQAECVRRLRDRTQQFIGGNPDAPVSAKLEKLVNTVLLAPSHEDAVDGIYQVLSWAVSKSYMEYTQHAHVVHDAPTVLFLQEIVTIKEQHRLWLRNYRRRNPHQINKAYRESIEKELHACQYFREPLTVGTETAKAVGVNTNFLLPATSARPEGSECKFNVMEQCEIDFTTSIEARRLAWMILYMRELNLADDQLYWIWGAHYMPWDFIHTISRHLWDESRHGDSGYSRMQDFGIKLSEVGFPPRGGHPIVYDNTRLGTRNTLTPLELYEVIFFIGMVAETGHFEVKNEAYADFKEGGDLESAEMMLFDIIDETTHVQYAHRWLPLLAEKAGVDNSNYRKRSLEIRKDWQQKVHERVEKINQCPRDSTNADYVHYQKLLKRIRDILPLTNEKNCPPRSQKPM